LKRATGLPWIADFRDPWSDIDYLDDFHLTRWARRTHKRLERKVVQTADRMLVTARGAARGVGADPNRVWWIPNGWDESDFHSQARPSHTGAFVLAHFGSLYASRNFTAVWAAVAAWNAVSDNRRIQLQFFGNTAPEVVASLAAHLTPGRDFVVHGNLPHREAVDEMHRAHALLILHNDTASGSQCIPGKLFEYLATGRPVLAVGPVPGDMAAIIAEELQPAGCPWWVHSPRESEDIAKSIEELVADDNAQGPLPIAGAFERRALTADLALKLNELIAQHPPGNPEPATRVNS
jgi:glycosyltransferase involved in cell wall biosynthesis